MLFQAFEEIYLCLIFLIALDHFLSAVYPAVDKLDIGEDKLQVDSFDISAGVDVSVHVNDIVVLKAADNMNDSVHLADIRQEFVSQTLAL